MSRFKTGLCPSRRTTIRCPEESLTKQAFKDECDINRIMKRFEKTGLLPMPSAPPQYGDYSELPDYQEALNLVIYAQSQFQGLDSRVRERFANDPEQFLKWVNDPNNLDEAIKLGLAPEREEKKPGASKKGVKPAPKPPSDAPPPSEGGKPGKTPPA